MASGSSREYGNPPSFSRPQREVRPPSPPPAPFIARRQARPLSPPPMPHQPSLSELLENQVSGRKPQPQQEDSKTAFDRIRRTLMRETAKDAMVTSKDVGFGKDLSDLDLRTLLKNFPNLGCYEQNGLMHYLRQLQIANPDRLDSLKPYMDPSLWRALSERKVCRIQCFG